MISVMLGTAGHIDHGKTALVRALTGIDTDRLPEEKRRGITIDIGFAHLDLTPQLRLAIIDVPGHEAFVRNMAAGTSGVDLGLLVVAADEGVKPQTREHLDILELLGVPLAAVALSKADRVDHDWLELVADDVRTFLGPAHTGVPIVATSALTGEGLDRLRDLLLHSTSRIARADHADLFRMPVDRVFTMTGTGTILTGTVWSGQLQRDDAVRLIPSNLVGRVRSLQRQGSLVDTVRSGERAAVAVAGVAVQSVKRGDALVSSSDWLPAQQLTVQLRVLPQAARALRDRQRVHLHLGTAAVTARIRLFGLEIQPGSSDLAVLQLEDALAARAGDRFMLRSYSPVTTIAGGRVLDWMPQRVRRRRNDPQLLQLLSDAEPCARAAAALQLAGVRGIALSQMPLHIIPPLQLPESSLIVHQTAFHGAISERVAERVRILLRALHARFPMRSTVDLEMVRAAVPDSVTPALREHVIQQMAARGEVRLSATTIALTDWTPTLSRDQASLQATLSERLKHDGISMPELNQLTRELGPDVRELLHALVREGSVTRITPNWFLWTPAVSAAQNALAEVLSRGPCLPQELKAVLGLSRKHLIPFLEYCDRTGLTARIGDQRTLTSLKAVSDLGDATR